MPESHTEHTAILASHILLGSLLKYAKSRLKYTKEPYII